MITLLTCTGDRPLLFQRLERWMARQTVPWTHWIVVDDGVRPTRCTLGQRSIRLPAGSAPSVSFAKNLAAAFDELSNLADSEFVCFIEDDDWYAPDYLASMLA